MLPSPTTATTPCLLILTFVILSPITIFADLNPHHHRPAPEPHHHHHVPPPQPQVITEPETVVPIHHMPSADSHPSHPSNSMGPHSHPHPSSHERSSGCDDVTFECVTPVQCPAHVQVVDAQKTCSLRGGRSRGICCNTGQNHTEFLHHKGRGSQHIIRHIDAGILGNVARHSRVEVAELHMREARLLSSGRASTLAPGSASYGHFRNTRVLRSSELAEVMSVANRALEIALATRAFKDRQGITNHQLEYGMVQQDLRPTPLGPACATIPHCPPVGDRYRRIDGACNNLMSPTWGAPLTPYARLLPPMYQDGVWAPRVSEDHGQALTSPRVISYTVLRDVDVPNLEYTQMVMQYGQFLSHDITQSIDSTFANGSAISCCAQDGSSEVPVEFRHFACMPIIIPPKDPFFSYFKQGCMNFVRSVLAPRHDCTLGYAQQMNKITHFIDGSSVYGSSPEQTAELRSFEGGRLIVFRDFNRDLLPLAKNPDACLTMEQGSACFSSGDSRTNQMISLVVLHTIFLREHNRLADELSRLNPHWEDEQVFLEARRICTAEMQVVTYREYLPAILGDKAMEEFDLDLAYGNEYSFDYDQRVDPSVTNEFAAAAFRFGHSTVDGLLKIYGLTKMEEMISIPETMFYPARMRKHEFMDELLSSLTTEPIQEVDNSISDALTKYMFRAGNPFGVDLASLNIQRGRDHGLRPYNDYRELVGQPRIKSFAEFGPEMGPKLQSVYASVEDIDLWVGGLLERKHEGSIMGPTFRDIIADQFSRLKKGDKYFFEHDPSINPSHFKQEQLVELRKASMSRIICDNSDQFLLLRQARNAFRRPGVSGNEFYDCSTAEIPRVNLILWQDQSYL